MEIKMNVKNSKCYFLGNMLYVEGKNIIEIMKENSKLDDKDFIANIKLTLEVVEPETIIEVGDSYEFN